MNKRKNRINFIINQYKRQIKESNNTKYNNKVKARINELNNQIK